MALGVTAHRPRFAVWHVGFRRSMTATPTRHLTGRSRARLASMDDDELAAAGARLEGEHPRDVIAWALERFTGRQRVVVTGLQAEGVAIADMAIAIDPAVRVLTVDTGRLPEATHHYLDRLRRHWQRDIEVVHPANRELDAFVNAHGPDPFYTSAQLRLECCHVRKVAPLEGVLRSVGCWMSGLRRRDSPGRAGTEVVERDHRHGGIVKVNPLAAWDDHELQAHIASAGVPTHPLYAQGYRSIGCAPCTRAVAPDEDHRAGRWWWEAGVDKECGIHATPTVAAG